MKWGFKKFKNYEHFYLVLIIALLVRSV